MLGRMARRADVPCAGDCGRLLWAGTGSLPRGEAVCQECRRRGLGPKKPPRRCACGTPSESGRCRKCYAASKHPPCVICGKPVPDATRGRRCCSRTCGTDYAAQRRPPPRPKPIVILFRRCKMCPTWFQASSRRVQICPAHGASDRVMYYYRTDPAYRDRTIARAQARRVWPPDMPRWVPREVAELDGWTCGLCGEAIDPGCMAGPGRLVVDHWLPLSRGGTHALGNVQAAHHTCNARKHAQLPPSGQLSPGDRRALVAIAGG
jgi:hypothetical protein